MECQSMIICNRATHVHTQRCLYTHIYVHVLMYKYACLEEKVSAAKRTKSRAHVYTYTFTPTYTCICMHIHASLAQAY